MHRTSTSRPSRAGSPTRTASIVLAVCVVVSTMMLLPVGSAASSPVAHGPGSPQWSRHLELEYGDRTSAGPVAHGPGSPQWSRHLELEYGV
jgi:hypothetical protein